MGIFQKTILSSGVLPALLLVAAGAARPIQAQDGPYDKNANPQHDIEAAMALARVDHKLVLLDFGANWCLDCIVLSRLFEDKTVEPYLTAHFHVVVIDVGEFNRNLDVSKAYGDPIEGGVPAVVVVRPGGTVIATTKDGALENARTGSPGDILLFLQSWVAIR